MAPCRNLLPYVSPLFQLSSLPSDSDCTCYFSSLCHHVNKRCRHLFHNKKENYEALALSFSSPNELLKPFSLFPLSVSIFLNKKLIFIFLMDLEIIILTEESQRKTNII